MMKATVTKALASAVAVSMAFPLPALAGDTPTEPTRREGYVGYDQPNQYIARQAVKIADNMMPVMQHPEQDKEARQKLAALEKRTGKKPKSRNRRKRKKRQRKPRKHKKRQTNRRKKRSRKKRTIRRHCRKNR